MADPLETTTVTPAGVEEKKARRYPTEAQLKERTGEIFGTKADSFSQTEISRMSKGGKSDLATFQVERPDGTSRNITAKLSVRNEPDGTIKNVYHEKINKPLQLDDISGNKISFKERDALEAGKAIFKKDIPSKDVAGKTFDSWVQIDKDLNQLVMVSDKAIALPEKYLGKEITEENRQTMRDTGSVRIEGMISKQGNAFNAELSPNIIERKMDFKFDPKIAKSKNQEVGVAEIKDLDPGVKNDATAKKDVKAAISQDEPENEEKTAKSQGRKR